MIFQICLCYIWFQGYATDVCKAVAMRKLVAALAFLVLGTFAMDNGVARTPPLGWSTWQTCGDAACGHDVCNEAEVKAAAVALNSSGMQKLGYTYVNLDDCWVGPRDNSTNRLTWDTSRFPSGIPALTAWLHARGLKFGLYTSAGTTTCANKAGSRGHYEVANPNPNPKPDPNPKWRWMRKVLQTGGFRSYFILTKLIHPAAETP